MPKLVIREAGIARAVIIVLRMLRRKKNITPAARIPPRKTSYPTSEIASSMKKELSKETETSTPGGRVLFISTSFDLTVRATFTTFAPERGMMLNPTAGTRLNRAIDRTGSVPSSVQPTSFKRMGAPF